MVGLFTKQKHDMGRIHYILKLAFERVKSDMHNIFSWIDYFHKKHQQHDEKLASIEERLNQILHHRNNLSMEEIRQMIDYHSPEEKISRIYKKIEELHSRIDNLETHKPQKKAALKERLMKKISRNSKDYIKSVVLGTVKKYGRISGPQLKEIIVEEQGLCSKSSFYRILNELEEENSVSSFQDGKEKTFFFKTQITN